MRPPVPHPPLHPRLAREAAASAALPPVSSLTVAQARAAVAARYATAGRAAVEASVSERWIDGPAGPLRLRIYHPGSVGTALPLTLYYHGGGFVLMDLDTHDSVCRQLCRDSGSIVVSLDYQLAPEHPWPAAEDDAMAALHWVARHAHALGGDAARIAVAGDSAGGNLAAMTALRTRDEGGPVLCAQLLLYPVTDGPDGQWPSRAQFASGFGLSSDTMDWFWRHYLPSAEQRAAYRPPLQAPSLAGLPPACVATAGYDLLRDEGQAYGRRLQAAGVPVELHAHAALNHAFAHWGDAVPPAAQAMAAAGAWLGRALTPD